MHSCLHLRQTEHLNLVISFINDEPRGAERVDVVGLRVEASQHRLRCPATGNHLPHVPQISSPPVEKYSGPASRPLPSEAVEGDTRYVDTVADIVEPLDDLGWLPMPQPYKAATPPAGCCSLGHSRQIFRSTRPPTATRELWRVSDRQRDTGMFSLHVR